MSTLAAASSSSSSSATSSPRCVPFAFRRGAARRRLPAPDAGGCGRPLCRPAEALGGGIQSAFFASLDRCSCVEIRTKSFKEPEPDDAVPLVPPTPPHDDSGSAAAAGSGWRRSGSAAGKPRRGLGCCTPTTDN
ncbi:hypothetical protein Zm00014a_003480 [Zea mays]|uniref:Uncharacterized protein n=1 Tax=Zea mays TaxID=4577 RepID=A0A317YIZ0_MAIZE|nr:hypothetical protein Zm00014a_003480 [Zea mays]